MKKSIALLCCVVVGVAVSVIGTKRKERPESQLWDEAKFERQKLRHFRTLEEAGRDRFYMDAIFRRHDPCCGAGRIKTASVIWGDGTGSKDGDTGHNHY